MQLDNNYYFKKMPVVVIYLIDTLISDTYLSEVLKQNKLICQSKWLKECNLYKEKTL